MNRTFAGLVALALIWSWSATGSVATAQQILLDDSVQAAGLTLYRDLRKEDVYYYLPNRPRLAVNDRGEPAFSFTRWVKNVRSAGDAEEVREGEGGGFVHFLVELTVDDETLARARRELRRVKPGATLQGAVGYRSGRMALVVTDPSEDGLVTEVLGVGQAPLLGGRAGVGLTLSKDGARVFWQAFQEQASPPLGFSFLDMEVAGFREKTGVVIRADLEKIYKHKAFAAGVASTYFGAEIEAAFDDLRESGAITEEWIGEDKGFEALVGQTYRQLLLELFEPAADLQALSGVVPSGVQGGGMLGQANSWLKQRRAEHAKSAPAAKPATSASSASAAPAASGASSRARVSSAPTATTSADKAKAAAAEQRATKAEAKAKELEAKVKKLREEIAKAEKATGDKKPSAEKIAKAKQLASSYDKQIETLRTQAKKDKAEAARLRRSGSSGSATPAGSTATVSTSTTKPDAKDDAEVVEEDENSEPAIAVLASFRMKKRSVKKELVISLNRHRSDVVPERFDGEIGPVGDCRRCFLEINQDDPLYIQREIFVYLDGLQPEFFEKSVNFATVQLRKRHASGAITDDEVRIDRQGLERTGNRFKLLYGWKGDNERERWLDYEYRVVWSFFGGHSIEEPWRKTTDGAINLAPPLVPRGVSLASNADALAEAQVRLVTVRLFYDLGGGERVETVSLRPELGELAGQVDLLRPRDATEYDYEIEWTLRGSRSLRSGRQTTSAGTLFLDELPTE